MPIDLASDNVAGASPAILAAIAAAAAGTVPSYGADDGMAALTRELADLFEHEVAVFPVVSGTAANALSLAAMCPSYGAVACSDCAHVLTSECGAPEFFMGGGRLAPVATASGLLEPASLRAAIVERRGHGVHDSQIFGVTLTQATEWGTVYTAEQVAAIAAVAHEHELPVHMDGARFANALVRQDVSPAQATWRAGVDILSFGATKNGALAAEAIVVFAPALARSIAARRKQSGHLLSKHRFLTAQLRAYLADGLWLRNAHAANAMAGRLADGLMALGGVSLAQPVETNEIFARIPEAMAHGMEARGVGFYRWEEDRSGVLIRLVTSFATTAAEIDAVLEAARASSE